MAPVLGLQRSWLAFATMSDASARAASSHFVITPRVLFPSGSCARAILTTSALPAFNGLACRNAHTTVQTDKNKDAVTPLNDPQRLCRVCSIV